ncbi:Neutral alpha-glucosidase C [Tritrichomonas foetus]|uniref:Maltase n=1 Tax=Tritrichomonas foetus TaxID=1144522 RepID=A0A1J4J3D5_9EUKA|nr:Neutral alpha-glucosidase C [Tritrichomonas foetus]|eukprot:OHS93249.1 Neutral alpha-glucosidase C [Tritrichomonas foetus]
MFCYLICTINCIFRGCNDMRFCRENIDKQSYWSIDDETIKTTNNHFSANLHKNWIDAYVTVNIYILQYNSVRVYFDSQNDKLNRFKLSEESLVFDQDVINKHLEFKFTQDELKCTLQTDQQTVDIYLNPFNIIVTDKKGSSVKINTDQQLVYEHEGKEIPTEQIDDWTDYFKNGATAVGLDFEFPGKNIKLTGLAEKLTKLNLDDCDSKRLYNLDKYSEYGNIPMVYAHSPEEMISVFWINPSDTFARIQTTDESRKINYISESGYADVIIFTGTFQEILNSYTELTGKIQMPPMWALGYHQCKWGYKTQEMVEGVIQGLEKLNFPMDTMWLDIDHLQDSKPFTFGYDNFPNPRKLIDDLADDHRHLVRINDPHMPKDLNHKQYKEALELGYFVKNSDGSAPFEGSCWPGTSSWPDFLNPKVREWWASQYNYDVDVNGTAPNVFFWNDMNEPSVFSNLEQTMPKDVIFYKDHEIREVHNLYGLSMTASTHQGLINRDQNSQLKPQRPFLLSRSWGPGSQKFTWQWNGDNSADFNNLLKSIAMTITTGMLGMPLAGTDIGGFGGNPSVELLVRWYQASVFLYPFMREHASIDSPFREPYLYDEENQIRMRNAAVLRYKFIPFWYTTLHVTTLTSIPPIQPLFTLYNDDEEYHNNEEQFILGESLLVSPVVKEGATSISFKLPPNDWFDYHTGERLNGLINRPVTMDSIPVFIQNGKIVPVFSETGKNVYETMKNPISLLIAVNEKGHAEGDLYLDDGSTYDYLDGYLLHRKFVYDNKKITMQKYDDELHLPDEIKNNYINKLIIYGQEESIIEVDTEIFFNVSTKSANQNAGAKQNHIGIINSDSKTKNSYQETMIIGILAMTFAIVLAALVGYFIFHKSSINDIETTINDNTQRQYSEIN